MKNIDILLPYWGDPGLMIETVDSIRAQDTDSWHLIISDDCYADLTVMHHIEALNDPRITYIRQKKNIGITHNFNFLLDQATAEFCVFIGCDDRMLPDYVSRALSAIGTADFYQPGVQTIDRNGAPNTLLVDRMKRLLRPRRAGVYSGESLAISLCRGNWLYFPSIMWRTETVKRYRFDTRYTILEDTLLQLQMIRDGAQLYLDSHTCFEYRRSAESLSSKEKAKDGVRFKEEDEVYDSMALEFASIGWKKAARTAKRRTISRIHRQIS